MGPQVPRLQLLGSPGTEGQAARRAQGPCGDEGAGPGDHRPERRQVHGSGDRGAARLPRGLEGVLPARRDAAASSATSTSGSATGCGSSNSSSGSGGRPSTGSCERRGMPPRTRPTGGRPTPAAGGGTPSMALHIALPTSYFDRARSPEACWLTSTARTAGCGPARPVVWEGSSRDHRLPPIPISGARSARETGPPTIERDCQFVVFAPRLWPPEPRVWTSARSPAAGGSAK